MADSSYQFSPFFVDRIRYRVVRDDAVLELTPKLLDLLLHLLDNAGALVTKEQLLDALWPDAKSAIMLGLNYGPDSDPLATLFRPTARRAKVDLPEPDSPTSPKISPGRTLRVT